LTVILDVIPNGMRNLLFEVGFQSVGKGKSGSLVAEPTSSSGSVGMTGLLMIKGASSPS
jgi:hypothetical protein